MTVSVPEMGHYINLNCRQHTFQSVQFLYRVRPLVTPWTAAHQASLSITNSRSLLKLMSITLVMPSNHSSSVIPFSSCLQSFPASGFSQMSEFFTSCGQSIGASASASVLPLGWTGWISLQSKGLSSLLQHHSSKASILHHSAFFIVQLSHLYMTIGKSMKLQNNRKNNNKG